MHFLRKHWPWFLGAAVALVWWRMSSDATAAAAKVKHDIMKAGGL